MKNEELQIVFERFINGLSTPEEVKQLLHYFHLEQEGDILTGLVIQELARPSETGEAVLKKRQPMYQRVQEALFARIDSEREARIVPLWRKPGYQVAAAAMILFVSSVFLWISSQKQPDMIIVNVPYGQLRQITLPDSSKVWLNAGTKFQYPSSFTGKTRQVSLKEGQAFFEVVHNSHAPFIVHSKSLNVTVMGTSFDIKAFSNEHDSRITVATGKVGININRDVHHTTFLLPNQQAIVKAQHIITIQVTDDIAAWRDHRLVFENENLDNVFHALERKYKVHFTIQQPKLLNELTSMKLGNQPLSDVLTVLSFSKHFHYQFSNDSTVVIR